MRRQRALVCSAVFVLLFFSPRYASASWFQWGTEGSYVHQIAHLLFCGAMLFFIYQIRHESLQQQRGFRYLMWACGLLALWNLDAFVGHTLEWSLVNPVISGQGWSKRLLMEDLHSWVYYITRIDHYALLIPAFYLFYLGLKAFAQEQETGPP